jgi:hypothetical protein
MGSTGTEGGDIQAMLQTLLTKLTKVEGDLGGLKDHVATVEQSQKSLVQLMTGQMADLRKQVTAEMQTMSRRQDEQSTQQEGTVMLLWHTTHTQNKRVLRLQPCNRLYCSPVPSLSPHQQCSRPARH